MRIPGLYHLVLLLRRSSETEYERVMLLHRLRSRRGRIFTGILVVILAMGSAGMAQMNVKHDLDCLSLTVYFEARGESRKGQAAVAHVVMNRIADDRFPGRACAVVRQGGAEVENCQFSWWCDRRSDRPRHAAHWQLARDIARTVYWGLGDDPTAGALWYHATRVKPIWRLKLGRGSTIGRHIFYRDKRKKAAA